MKKETIYFGGGCFWCTEAVFSAVRGVDTVVSGYAGGHVVNPSYEQVSQGDTGHIEVVKVEFDPAIVSLGQLLEVFWLVHDPSSLDKQGADAGSQYHSVIFYTEEHQKQTIEDSRNLWEELNDKRAVTDILELDHFYTAEEYHQKFYNKNPDYSYCAVIIKPKLQHIKEKLPQLFKTV